MAGTVLHPWPAGQLVGGARSPGWKHRSAFPHEKPQPGPSSRAAGEMASLCKQLDEGFYVNSG